MSDELKEALGRLKVIGGFQEEYDSGRWRGSSITPPVAAAILAHIAAQDKRIEELEAALKSKTSRVKKLERMMLYIHTDEHGDVNYTDIDLREKIAELEAALAEAHDTIEEKAMEDDLKDWPNWPDASAKQ